MRMSDTADILATLLEQFESTPAPSGMLQNYLTSVPLEQREAPTKIRPSSLGRHPLVHQLNKLGYGLVEVLTPFSVMNLYRGSALELPLLAYLQSGFPGSQTQVSLEYDGISGTADLVTADGVVIDVKCSNGHKWADNPDYVKQLAFYSLAANGLEKPAYLVNYNGFLSAAEISVERLKRAWGKVQAMRELVESTKSIEEVINEDNPAWNSLPKRLTETYAWTLRAKGLAPYYQSFWENGYLLAANKALENLTTKKPG
jgi:hypothetical protein